MATSARIRPSTPAVPPAWHPATEAGAWLPWLVAVGLAAAVGAVVGLVTPRGPLTGATAVASVVGCFAVGFAGGLVTRSRRVALVAPLAFAVAVEIVRIGAEGVTVDAPRLTSTWGWATFVLGRGVHGVLALLPMALGGLYGAGTARRSNGAGAARRSAGAHPPGGGRRSALSWLRRGVAGLLAASLLALCVALLRPASTPPLVGPDGAALPGSIAQLTTVRVGGHDLGLSLRGQDVDNPVLLYLAGGPGESSLCSGRVFLSALTEHFTVAILDQRGTGSSYPALEPTSTLTLDTAVQDVVDVAGYLSRRFDEPTVYVVGESWGTLLGVLAVQRAPERFAAFIGSGQMVSVRETDRRLYRDVLALAARTGDEDLAGTMRGFGEPPYADPFAYAVVASRYEELEPFTESAAVRALAAAAGNDVGFWGLAASEYTLMDRLNYARGLVDVFDLLYPQIQDVDLRQDAARLDVPVYVALGAHELDARADLAREWFAALDAPVKELRTFADSAHAPVAQDYQEFRDWLLGTVVAGESRTTTP